MNDEYNAAAERVLRKLLARHRAWLGEEFLRDGIKAIATEIEKSSRLTAATPPETPVVAREIAREIVEDHLAPCAECFGNAMRDIENAIAAIITRYLVATPPASFIEAFRNTAIKYHGALAELVRLKPRLHDGPLEHQGPWEECDWIECEDRRKMIAELDAATPLPETPVGGEAQNEEMETCPVCKNEVPLDSMWSYNNVPNAFCQGCIDAGRV